MGVLDKTVWLQAEAGDGPSGLSVQSGCGHCVSASQGPVCVGGYGAPCAQPRVEGQAERVERVLQALREVADDEGNLVDTQRFSALRIDDDEVELTLTFPRNCSPTRVLAEDAFQALRRALPDTDVYVRLAG
ncbi:iron-sulfur cluster assembly protein [Rubrivivax albus]|uniref:DUF59 domain-containing protein n=1 Tax=Rubrivivax albus TaxID=2499835 RepID=A0A437JX51_9BURK|nr:iron-sulfur cluster assembly protein [Rubrivivax albus]RVT52210.1 DUF59 domain-containing protein [Rubrivivax albus]